MGTRRPEIQKNDVPWELLYPGNSCTQGTPRARLSLSPQFEEGRGEERARAAKQDQQHDSPAARRDNPDQADPGANEEDGIRKDRAKTKQEGIKLFVNNFQTLKL